MDIKLKEAQARIKELEAVLTIRNEQLAYALYKRDKLALQNQAMREALERLMRWQDTKSASIAWKWAAERMTANA